VTTDLARARTILIALSLTWVAGCRPPATTSSIYIDVNRVPPELRDEYASFATNCSKCHSLSRALNAPVTDPRHWDLYVARMMRTAGSAISPEEAPVILRFLHWYTRSYEHGGLPGDRSSSEGESESSAAASEQSVPEPQAPTSSSPAPDPLRSATEASPAPANDTPKKTETTAGEMQ